MYLLFMCENCAYSHIRMYMCVCSMHVSVCIHVCMNVCMRAHAYKWVRNYANMCVSMN